MSRKSNNPTLIGLTQQLKPDFLRQILGVNNTENDASEEPEDEAQWASAEGDDQPGSDDAYASF